MTEKHDIMSLNQQVDAKKLIEDISQAMGREDLTTLTKVAVSAVWIKRYKEKWSDKMTISQRDFDLLNGLEILGVAYVAAGEIVDARRLEKEGLVSLREMDAQPVMWKLTGRGVRRISEAKRTGEAII
jgi:hypothetical protein